ncbi:hypothetical protein JCM11491_005787 [Sporobolomyces phaffii]
MPPLPTLPTELIDEILLESVFSTSDFVRCCLVSRQFLPIAQQLLYYSVQITTYFARSPDSPLHSHPLNVRKLRCLILDRYSARVHLPAALTVLDIGKIWTSTYDFSLDFYDPSSSRLEVIRLPIQSASTNLGRFKHLHHLVLHQFPFEDIDLTGPSFIADCSSLKTLAFEYCDASFLGQLLAFLLSSPASLTRLEFPLYIPFDVLTSLLDPSVRPPFRLEILALSAGTAFDPKNAANFENLRSLCTSQGIQIELMKGPRDVFYV